MSRVTRRGLLKTGAAAGVLAATGVPVRAMPNRGGTLRLGLIEAAASDTWDGRTHAGTFMMVMGHGCVFDCLTEIDAEGALVGELAESWEASAGGKVWTFNLRRGVTFHNGKPFGADDVIASLALHVAPGSMSPARPIVETIAEMRKITDHQVQFTLAAGNADFPYLMADYHLLMYPAGQIDAAIAQGIGTGLYRVEDFQPGARASVRRVDSHYKDGRAGWFDAVDAVALAASDARMAALFADKVDAVAGADLTAEAHLRANPDIEIVEVTGNAHYTFPMPTNLSPYDALDLRKALKHVINRQEMVDTVLRGHGRVANDHPIGPANQFFATELPQTDYDPDRARFLLAQAGLDGATLDLPGASEAAAVVRAAGAAAGLTLNIRAVPNGICAGRATEDWMFATAYGSGAPWNVSRWENARFQELLPMGRSELNTNRRRDIYTEMQALCADEGGTIIPVFANYVDAVSTRLTNSGTVGNIWRLDSSRIAERWWFA